MVAVPAFDLARDWPDAEADGPKRVVILGATGSIGKSAIDVIGRLRGRFVVDAVTAHRNAAELARLARETGARLAVLADPAGHDELKAALAGSGIEAAAGPEAVVEAATRPSDLVLSAIVGAAGLAPTLAALKAGRHVALANKESLVCAGALFLATAKASGARVLPVDSEHNAIFQVLEQRNAAEVDRLILTASGGPFRTWPTDRMARASAAEALRHPNWSMGPKITIDSATLMNKGLELIEAHHLFAMPAERLEVLIHPQSAVHGLVAYADGSMLAQMGPADMRTPICHCLAWPRRFPLQTARLDLAALGTLTFERPDETRFPALGIAREALAAGGWATNILNAANEVAVAAFLGSRIGFLEIARLVAEALERGTRQGLKGEPETVEEALALDATGRRFVVEAMQRGTR